MNVRSVLRVWSLIAVVGVASGLGPVAAQDATPAPESAAWPPEAEVAGVCLAAREPAPAAAPASDRAASGRTP